MKLELKKIKECEKNSMWFRVYYENNEYNEYDDFQFLNKFCDVIDYNDIRYYLEDYYILNSIVTSELNHTLNNSGDISETWNSNVSDLYENRIPRDDQGYPCYIEAIAIIGYDSSGNVYDIDIPLYTIEEYYKKYPLDILKTFNIGDYYSYIDSDLNIYLDQNIIESLDEYDDGSDEILAAQLIWHWREYKNGKTIIVVKPNKYCKCCNGLGEFDQRHDKYGMPETLICDCVLEQISDDIFDNIDIVI